MCPRAAQRRAPRMPRHVTRACIAGTAFGLGLQSSSAAEQRFVFCAQRSSRSCLARVPVQRSQAPRSVPLPSSSGANQKRKAHTRRLRMAESAPNCPLQPPIKQKAPKVRTSKPKPIIQKQKRAPVQLRDEFERERKEEHAWISAEVLVNLYQKYVTHVLHGCTTDACTYFGVYGPPGGRHDSMPRVHARVHGPAT